MYMHSLFADPNEDMASMHCVLPAVSDNESNFLHHLPLPPAWRVYRRLYALF